uniref:Rv1733c family protein n=1 Tax=Rhodococcus opacus TaxID=37919 RepID=UPI003F659145
MIPVAAAFGTATHTRLEQQAQALRAGVHPVPAVLLEDTYLAPASPEYTIRPAGTQNAARALWTTPNGERTGAVPTNTPGKAGQTITISVDTDGNLTGAIPDSRENTVLTVTAACGLWALAAGAVLLSTALARRLFTRNRLRRWEQEWTQFDIPPREPR